MPLSVFLKPKEEFRILNGHVWVYNNEIHHFEGSLVSGELAYVYSSKGLFLGKGFLNTSSKISVRILSRTQEEEINQAWFEERIARAKQYKEALGYLETYRLVFGEADGIPGLIIDKYQEYLVIQITSYGLEAIKTWIVNSLVNLFHPKGILERSDIALRQKEGLNEQTQILYGSIPASVLIHEGQLEIEVNLLGGQKTGTFLDQVSNHLAIQSYVKNKSVLDCFAHIGGFGLQAAFFGAKHVTFVEMSQQACDQIVKNAKHNHLEAITVVKADVFSQLRLFQEQRQSFDVIVLDPPAFTKNKDQLAKAYAGYKEINLQAMKCLTSGGYLITCSCSHYMTPALFLQMLQDASADAKKQVQMIEFRTQGKDHPTLLGFEESLYLKCVVLRVSDYV